MSLNVTANQSYVPSSSPEITLNLRSGINFDQFFPPSPPRFPGFTLSLSQMQLNFLSDEQVRKVKLAQICSLFLETASKIYSKSQRLLQEARDSLFSTSYSIKNITRMDSSISIQQTLFAYPLTYDPSGDGAAAASAVPTPANPDDPPLREINHQQIREQILIKLASITFNAFETFLHLPMDQTHQIVNVMLKDGIDLSDDNAQKALLRHYKILFQKDKKVLDQNLIGKLIDRIRLHFILKRKELAPNLRTNEGLQEIQRRNREAIDKIRIWKSDTKDKKELEVRKKIADQLVDFITYSGPLQYILSLCFDPEDKIPGSLPDVFDSPAFKENLDSLKIINFKGTLPPSIFKLEHLRTLELSHCGLQKVPSEIGNLHKLESLALTGNALSELPTSLPRLTGLQFLHLDNNQLTSLNMEHLDFPNLELLNLENNQLSTLPDGELPALRYLKLSQNLLSSYPSLLRTSTSLRYLDLSKSKITTLPDFLQQLPLLEEFDISYNECDYPDKLGVFCLSNSEIKGNYFNTELRGKKAAPHEI